MPPHSQSLSNLPTNETIPAGYTRTSNFAARQPPLQPQNTPAVQSTRMPIFPNRLGLCNFPGTDSSTSNCDFKSESFYRQFLVNPTSPTVNRCNKDYLNTPDAYFSPNQPKSLFHKYLWSSALVNKPTEQPYERFPFDALASRYNQPDTDVMPTKDVSGGIAELERVFGSSVEQRSNPLNNGSKFGSKLSTTIHDNSDCPSEENSDVDCEQL